MKKYKYGMVCTAVMMAATSLAQSQTPDLRTEAGCGPASTQFEVKTDKSQHAVAQPGAGKALVYAIVEEKRDPTVKQIGDVTTRVGLDGNWVGANHGESYISFAVDPGEHRVCSDWQSKLKSLQKLSGAADLTAEAGKTYFYRVEVVEEHGHVAPDIKVKAVDSAEGVLLISRDAASAWKLKK